MPYIAKVDRQKFGTVIDQLSLAIKNRGISNGELNWLFTMIGQMYLARHGTSYNTLSDVVKAFECAKLEFYRRAVAPYEDKKAEQNGDIYRG